MMICEISGIDMLLKIKIPDLPGFYFFTDILIN
ncbi:hypothetical protein M876_08400 [Elizabethkingia anophelis FMS-007]|nr:hypothetical protein M876_08400 [Elizabethkingia anophelis FMS-007]